MTRFFTSAGGLLVVRRRDRRFELRAEIGDAELFEQLLHLRINFRHAMREHLRAGFLLLAGIGRKSGMVMRGDHLQRDAIGDRIFRRRLDIDAGFAALAAFPALAAGPESSAPARDALRDLLGNQAVHCGLAIAHRTSPTDPSCAAAGNDVGRAACEDEGADADPDLAGFFHGRSHGLTRMPRADTPIVHPA